MISLRSIFSIIYSIQKSLYKTLGVTKDYENVLDESWLPTVGILMYLGALDSNMEKNFCPKPVVFEISDFNFAIEILRHFWSIFIFSSIFLINS